MRRDFLSPPIIRDRAGAIRPDFSVCVEGSVSPFRWGSARSVIACLFRSLLESGKGVGGLSFGLPGRRPAAISGCAHLVSRHEPVWLTQDVALSK